MTKNALGTFEVTLTPEALDDKFREAGFSRLTLDKQFHGDLQAASKGEMLAVSTEVQGSAGYVAIERVSGTLHCRCGDFALQHSGTMTRGAPQMSITVVPDSGGGELKGLTGRMMIQIADGKHSYDFEYTLTESS